MQIVAVWAGGSEREKARRVWIHVRRVLDQLNKRWEGKGYWGRFVVLAHGLHWGMAQAVSYHVVVTICGATAAAGVATTQACCMSVAESTVRMGGK